MREKTGICLLNDSFPPLIDGVANAVVNYAQRLTERGDAVTVATPAVPGADDSAFPFPVLRYPSFDTRKKLGYVSGRPFSPELAARLQKEGVGVLHTHCPIVSTFLARELRDVVDAPIVLTYHTKFDIDIAKAVRGKLLQESAIHALVQNISACDEVWTVSHGAGENLRSLGYQGDYLVMPNGVDLPRGRLAPEEIRAVTGGFDLPDGVPCFLFVGRLMWYKGIRIILDALASLRDQGQPFRMVFLGGGVDEPNIRKYTEELGLTDRCLFPGSVRDRQALRAWYCRADLFLFPSTFDTNGLVVRSVGELMALSGQISAFGEELSQELRCGGSEVANKMRTGYEETKEKLVSGGEEFARKLRENQAETKEKFLATGEELARKMRENQAESRERWDSFCQMLDRYL